MVVIKELSGFELAVEKPTVSKPVKKKRRKKSKRKTLDTNTISPKIVNHEGWQLFPSDEPNDPPGNGKNRNGAAQTDNSMFTQWPSIKLFKKLRNKDTDTSSNSKIFVNEKDENNSDIPLVLNYITRGIRTEDSFPIDPALTHPFVANLSVDVPNKKGVLKKVTLSPGPRSSKLSKHSHVSRRSIDSRSHVVSKDGHTSFSQSISSKPSLSSSIRQMKGLKLRSNEVEKPIVPTYQLSNAKYLREGWTKLRQPNFKITEKLFTFHTSLCQPLLNAFQKRKGISTSYYENNQLAALFQEEGGSYIYYPNGEIALSITEGRVGPKLVVYSMTTINKYGVFMPSQPMAIFDRHGNGAVYSYEGELRLNYDQAEGALYDTSSRQPVHWMWKINEYLKQRRADLDGVNPDANDDIIVVPEGPERRSKSSRRRSKKHSTQYRRKSHRQRKSIIEPVSTDRTPSTKKSGSIDDSISDDESPATETEKPNVSKAKPKRKRRKRVKKVKDKSAKETKTKDKDKEKEKGKEHEEKEKKPKEKKRKRGKKKPPKPSSFDSYEFVSRPKRSTINRPKMKRSSYAKKSKNAYRARASTYRSTKRLHRRATMRDLPPLRDPPLKPAPIVEIRPIAMKITDHISLRIMDQSHIHVDFFYYPKHFRFHVGVNIHPEHLMRIDKVIDPQPVTNIVSCYFELMHKRSHSLFNLYYNIQQIKKQAFKQRKIVTLKKCRLMGYKYEMIRRRRHSKGASL